MILNPHLSHQFEILSRLSWIKFVINFLFLPDLNIQLLSANSDESTSLSEPGRSLIIIKKSKGDMMEPWAVPLSKTYMISSGTSAYIPDNNSFYEYSASKLGRANRRAVSLHSVVNGRDKLLPRQLSKA